MEREGKGTSLVTDVVAVRHSEAGGKEITKLAALSTLCTSEDCAPQRNQEAKPGTAVLLPRGLLSRECFPLKVSL